MPTERDLVLAELLEEAADIARDGQFWAALRAALAPVYDAVPEELHAHLELVERWMIAEQHSEEEGS